MPSQAYKDALRVSRCLQAVSKVVKERFPNLTVDETLKISADVLLAVDEVVEQDQRGTLT